MVYQRSSKHCSRHLQEGARESPLCFPQTVNLNVATAMFAKTLELLQHMMQLIQESQICALNPSCENLRTKIIKYIFVLKYQYYYCISFPQISNSRIQQCLIKFKTQIHAKVKNIFSAFNCHFFLNVNTICTHFLAFSY